MGAFAGAVLEAGLDALQGVGVARRGGPGLFDQGLMVVVILGIKAIRGEFNRRQQMTLEGGDGPFVVGVDIFLLAAHRRRVCAG